MIKEIGLTGGIGSGKTTIAGIFETYGFKVYYADLRAKALYQEDADMKAEVISVFGKDIYTPEGDLDRKKLAGIVFQDREKLDTLNKIVHPATLRDFKQWMAELNQGNYNKPFILKEAAILFEAGSHVGLDGVLGVYAPKNTRLARVLKRDGVVRSEVLARMDKQFPESFKLFHSDFTIYSDGNHHLIPQVQSAINYFSADVPD